MKKKIIGYTGGIFDLFHIGHLNVIKKAKSMCDFLIVGICDDDLSYHYKGKYPLFPLKERIQIVKSLKYVDKIIIEKENGVMSEYKKHKFDIIFKGDDWKGTDKWNKLEKEFNKLGVKIVFFPYTKTTSSTIIKNYILKHEKNI